MDIICAKCGKHFSSIEAAREHSGNCKNTPKDEPIHWISEPKLKITPEEWEAITKLINDYPQSPQETPENSGPTTPKAESSKQSDKHNAINHSKKPNKSDIFRTIVKNMKMKPVKIRLQKWMMALLLIFALSLLGLGISLFIGISIPFWILLVFSLFYSIEKWFAYPTRKYKYLGKIYRLLLNLSILALIGLLIWSGIKLFSQQFHANTLVGSLVFIAEFVLFIWMCRTVSKNSWRWPSMKLTIFSLICLSVIFAFAGVPPMSVYKENLVTSWNTYQADREEKKKQLGEEQEKEKPEPYNVLQFNKFTDESTGFRVEYPQDWISTIISMGDELSTKVRFEGTIGQSNNTCSLVISYDSNFNDARGIWTSMVNLASTSLNYKSPITISQIQGYELIQDINGENNRIFVGEWKSGLLIAYRSYPIDALAPSEINTLNNYLDHLIITASIVEPNPKLPEPTPTQPIVGDILKPESILPDIEESNTRNPSWEELKAFLLKDDTDKMEYVFPTTVCEDFARKLQENAKEVGWRCAFVSVQLEGYPDWFNLGISSYTGHACNAFETTDRGLLYIDCTSTIGEHPLHQDSIVDVQIGNDYIPKQIFPSAGWSSSALSMGKIVRINTVRW